MHELSIAEDILGLVATRMGVGQQLSSVHLTLGPLSGVSADALQFCFPELAELQGFGRPKLIVEEPPAQIRCLDCGYEYGLRDFGDGCPVCGSWNREVRSGRQFTVDWIEVEDI